MITEKVLQAYSITKSFSKELAQQLLQGITLEIEKGDSIAITGRSGSGKSTLLHILAALDAPSGGSVTICGEKVTEKNAPLLRNKHIGFIFQSFHLLDDFSLIDNILMPARIARLGVAKSSAMYKRALQLMEAVGLSDRKDSPTKLLSGGEKQRACLARALILSPDIIFADEPTGSLDSYHSAKITNLLFDLVKAEGKTLILVTHDTDLARLCNKTFHLKDGFLHLT